MINKERLYNRIMELGQIGIQESGGVSRIALTQLDQQGLELIARYMREAGLEVRTDAAGNLIGRKEGKNPLAPAVLSGSHSDTVYEGGMFDGALGILGGIEALQTMNENNIVTEHPIEVCVYRDEEGCRFTSGYSGARAMTGSHDPAKLSHTDRDGISIADALRELGIDPDRVGEAARPRGSVKAHVELHIEQGKVLESKNLSVGIVTGICASSRMRVCITGEAGHAGTTPMSIRRDPMAAAAIIIQAVEEEARKTGTTVATVGVMKVFPGGVNIIPGKVEFSIDCRDINPEVRDRVLDAIIERAEKICEARDVKFEINIFGRGTGKPCSEEVQQVIKEACQRLGLEQFTLPSGAGHDSGAFSGFCPMGMIFIRSRDGISHNPAEWSSPEDCENGVNVLYYTLLELAVPAESSAPNVQLDEQSTAHAEPQLMDLT